MEQGIAQAFAAVAQGITEAKDAAKSKPDVKFGTVRTVSDGTCGVLLDGDTSPTECVRSCAATVGDRVTIVVRGRSVVAVARIGGDGGTATNGLPAGGTAGQVLEKASSADYAAQWVTPAAAPEQTVFYGTCSTAAATQAKAVTADGFAATDLKAGTVLFVKFDNAQTYNGSPTLNVNSTGAVAVYRNGTNTGLRYMWLAGEVVCFVHDGTSWVVSDGGIATTTYYGVTKLSSSTSSTSTSLAATPAAVKSAYDLANGKQDPIDYATNAQIIGMFS